MMMKLLIIRAVRVASLVHKMRKQRKEAKSYRKLNSK